ncbi:geranylgeranyl pyrophosphate synthase [Actinoalloteichus sp. AHMU CJ021]|uniref:Geranylgeranyl diphosphate synthase, type I n=1 Tax=Actinoalloteichus caeruleus DSM 43889 TaxID=1120930 RepID=A0ABT1JH77_ACTCY|nr:polyprenyl synthetase family protein [Actinoalloteichus caeruleus]AUS77891.1 geranylgeranyl pyrophosphate synthase [Actinoalloteichus sp. AHMU CJ021]MCP2331854.1 geranylgeranyl diphosphate synthase, type I [Actinoalloteichus caeruleus DSM 43889]
MQHFRNGRDESGRDLITAVHGALEEFLHDRRATVALASAEFAQAVDALSGLVLGGGKRVRPTFAWWGWRAAGGDLTSPGTEAVVRAVSSLELIQGCALVHDDLMDDSPLRRGRPTVHVSFADHHRREGWRGAPERFGMASAVLLGDVALAWADDMFFGSGLSAEALARSLPVWHAMRSEMLAGQYLDMLSQVRGDEDAETALHVNRLKCAAYTVERPLHLGAAIAGAEQPVVDGLRRFGADIGIAFQLRDDLLGVFGDPEVTGKPAGDDLREGKRTLLASAGLRLAEEQGRTDALAELRGVIGDPELDADRVAATRALLLELGAVDEVEARIDQYTDSALRALTDTSVTEEARGRLTELAVSVTKRDQ